MSNISIIHSAVESIDALRVYPIPTKPLQNAKAVRVDRTVVMVDKSGRVYSTQVTGRFSFQKGDNRESIRNTITGAYRLGAISKAAMDEDLQLREAAALKHEQHYAANRLVECAKTIGIKLTEAQLRHINSAREQKAIT
jgi:hypothetical protein